MRYVSVVFLNMPAGVAGHIGVTHLLIGTPRRPCDWVPLLFALLFLSVTTQTLAVLALHTASSVSEYVFPTLFAFFWAIPESRYLEPLESGSHAAGWRQHGCRIP